MQEEKGKWSGVDFLKKSGRREFLTFWNSCFAFFDRMKGFKSIFI